MEPKVEKSEQEWREELSPEQFEVLRNKATQAPLTGKYVPTKDDGTYRRGGRGEELFAADTKFDSGSGWPSFTEPMNRANVELIEDRSHGMVRTEVVCANCGGHLGHVFDDGPRDRGGQRFCINSCSIELEPSS